MLLQFIEVSDTVPYALDRIDAAAKHEEEHFPEAHILFAGKGENSPAAPQPGTQRRGPKGYEGFQAPYWSSRRGGASTQLLPSWGD